MKKDIKVLKNKLLYSIVFTILVIISISDFYFSVKKENFFRFKYDLSKTEYLEQYKFRLTNFSHNSITLKKTKFSLKPHTTYEIKFKNTDETYIFAYDKMDSSKENIDLNGVVWYFKQPLEEPQEVIISKVKLLEKQPGKVKIAMITEQLGCCLMFGKQMRYLWNKKNHDISFLGNEKDVYSYPFYGGENITSEEIRNLSKNINKADIYVIWTGRNENNTEILINNLKIAFEYLSSVNPNAQFILLFPAPSPIPGLDNKIMKNVEALRTYNFNKVIKIDINALFKNKKDWRDRYFEYDYALSLEAYDLILEKLENEIN